MTDNGGGSPGNRGSEADADSWFKPSENRNRKQSEYQDPLENEGASEGDAPAGGAVFPDSGGYAGLSASRPAMVEPYPDALGGPPAAEQPQFVPGAISYPGAGTSAYQPVTRIPGDSDPLGTPRDDNDPGGGTEESVSPAPTGGYPGIAASAQVPLPPEDPESPSEPAHDSWATGTNDSWAPEPAREAPAPETPAEAPADDTWAADAPADAWSRQEPAAPAADTWSPEPSAPAADAWSSEPPVPATDAWSKQPPAPATDAWSRQEPAAPAADAWSPEPSAPAADAWSPEPPAPATDAWTPEPPAPVADAWSKQEPAPATDAWTPPAEDSWAPQASPEPAAPPVGEPWAPQPAQDAWEAPAEELWKPEPAQEQPSEWQGTGGLDSWSPAPDTGDEWKGAGTTEPWAEPAAQPWADHAHTPSPGSDRYDDELSPRPAPPLDGPAARTADQYGERYDDELSPSFSDAVPADQGGLGSGSGNTWAFDRNDPRLPDVVRDAERRRRESAPEKPSFTEWGADTGWDGGTGEERPAEQEGNPDTGELSAAVPTSSDPLAAIADMQSRAKAKETSEPQDELGSEPGQEWDERPWDAPARAEAAWDPQPAEEPAPASWEGTPSAGDDSWRGGEGATQMFTAPSFDRAPGLGGRGYDELGYDDRGQDARGYDERGYDERDHGAQGHGELGYDDRGQGVRGYEDREHGELGYEDRDHGAAAYGEQGHDELGYGERGYGEADYDELGGPAADRGPVAAGVPSDLGSGPSFDQGPFDQGADGRDREGQPAEDRAPEGESDYEDGFTPADYGMPERPKPSRRRRDRIAEDFPGFDDATESGDYPGYDSIDFLADTEPGANVTLWLGVASLIPGLGVITAVLALFVTGPKAKKAIRESRGALDGLGRITAGTVFAVIGIVVTVISLAIWLVL
ncbi:hypothetical protein [Nocardiopsis ganjiahuensis]|uniref:hypothetical protein n=1 Tax=Nocardiopsis ganjiahuensis TaxID=239984 RepID=UPI000348C3BC|nr:hypothetical protein [Nocardiopsis ganjiahuensis]